MPKARCSLTSKTVVQSCMSHVQDLFTAYVSHEDCLISVGRRTTFNSPLQAKLLGSSDCTDMFREAIVQTG